MRVGGLVLDHIANVYMLRLLVSWLWHNAWSNRSWSDLGGLATGPSSTGKCVTLAFV